MKIKLSVEFRGLIELVFVTELPQELRSDMGLAILITLELGLLAAHHICHSLIINFKFSN